MNVGEFNPGFMTDAFLFESRDNVAKAIAAGYDKYGELAARIKELDKEIARRERQETY